MKDQSKLDDDASVGQRLALGAGDALSGGGGMVADATGCKLGGDAMKAVGESRTLSNVIGPDSY